jgi:hypothetical protein
MANTILAIHRIIPCKQKGKSYSPFFEEYPWNAGGKIRTLGLFRKAIMNAVINYNKVEITFYGII